MNVLTLALGLCILLLTGEAFWDKEDPHNVNLHEHGRNARHIDADADADAESSAEAAMAEEDSPLSRKNMEITSSFVDFEIKKRLERLHTFAKALAPSDVSESTQRRDCSSYSHPRRYLLITEYQFGRAGNQLIELMHGLWLAERVGATLVLPGYMDATLKIFDLTLLHANFCLATEAEFAQVESTGPNGGEGEGEDGGAWVQLELESESSFEFWNVVQRRHSGVNEALAALLPAALPPLSADLVQDMSRHFLRVSALLWIQVHHNVVAETVHVMCRRLNGLDYVAVHKRNMEGGCAKLMANGIDQSEIPKDEVPMDDPVWTSNLSRSHPLCELTYSFVQKIVNMWDRKQTGHGAKAEGTKKHTDAETDTEIEEADADAPTAQKMPLFLAWDGQGSIDDYEAEPNTVLWKKHAIREGRKVDKNKLTYIDMFVAMQARLFVLNPQSTFSWQIFVVRTMLNLDSVPSLPTKDYTGKSRDIIAARKPMGDDSFSGLWVSWESIKSAARVVELTL